MSAFKFPGIARATSRFSSQDRCNFVRCDVGLHDRAGLTSNSEAAAPGIRTPCICDGLSCERWEYETTARAFSVFGRAPLSFRADRKTPLGPRSDARYRCGNQAQKGGS